MSTNRPAQSRLTILMAATSYPANIADWKGRFIHALAAGLGNMDKTTVALWAPPGQLPNGVVSQLSPADAACLQRMADGGGIAHLLRSRPLRGLLTSAEILSRFRKACNRSSADLYHVNWLQLALGLPDDQRPAYVAALGNDFGLLRLPGMTGLLRHKFAKRRTIVAPNAEWMSAELTERFGDVAEIRPNPFGVAKELFSVKRDTKSPRNWLSISRITREKLGNLCDWGQGPFGSARRLQLVGPNQEQLPLPNWIVQHGPTNPDELRNRWFPSAAGLLTLSRHHEGRPQVIVEAMAAGVPVIASHTPAHAEVIQNGYNGWLVSNREELENALVQAEDPISANEVGNSARRWVRKHVGTWEDYATRCVSAYHDLLERDPRDAN